MSKKAKCLAKRAPKRVIALVLCAAMLLSMTGMLLIMPAQAANPIGSLKNLYIREADENTMDSYVQASLGGYMYTQRYRSGADVDAVTTPTVRNNYGTRYAGEVWADKSVFARYQPVLAEIRPFEAEHIYTNNTVSAVNNSGSTKMTELERALSTLHYYLGDTIKFEDYGFKAGTTQADFEKILKSGALTSAQASALNAAINKAAMEDLSANYPYAADGDFNGETLTLGHTTDGLDTSITMDNVNQSDFLHVYSVLGSVQENIGVTPLDVVMVLDVSGSMGTANPTGTSGTGNGYNHYPNETNLKMYESVKAMNAAIQTLMDLNINNRVGVVVFASRPAVLMELGRYDHIREDAEGNKIYIDVQSYTAGDGWYRYDITASGDTVLDGKYNSTNAVKVNTSRSGGTHANGASNGTYSGGRWTDIGFNTNMDSGFWTGLGLLAEAENTVVTINNKQISRIPSFIFLGDGDPQYMVQAGGVAGNLTGATAGDNAGNGNWWAPADPTKNFYLGTANFNYSTVIASTVMHATLMKAVVEKHYQTAAYGADGVKGTDDDVENSLDVNLGFYSIGISLGQSGHATGRAVATAILDPGNANLGFNSSNNKQYTVENGVSKEVTSGGTVSAVAAARTTWDNWSKDGGTNVSVERRTFNQFPYATINGKSVQAVTVSGTQVTKAEVVAAFPYTDQFYSADTAEQITTALNALIQEITSPIWQAVSGTNAAYNQDSVTYSDPIGDYMTVDSVTDITLFGHRYQVTKGKTYTYTGTTEAALQAYINSLPDYIKKTNTNSSAEKIQNTTYTVYQITGEYTTKTNGVITGSASPLTSTTRYNLSYGDGTDQYFENLKKNGQPVERYQFDLLNDIHIWVEDTDEWRDSGEGGFVVDEGYSMALFINVSNKAIPVQIATVTMASNEDSPTNSRPKEYTTNLTNTAGSTPLRVFYNVSMDTQYLRYMVDAEQKKANATGVSLSKVTAEYLTSNTAYYKRNENGHYVKTSAGDEGAGRKVAFYSNYFSNDIYDEYPVMSDQTKNSRGNASVTFSPSEDNQFYRFQKNRVLFLIPGADEDFGRPAEIDLGYLETIEGLNKIAGTNFSSWTDTGASAWDPTTVAGLLRILNAARVANHTTYSNYDCIPVTGDHGQTIKPRNGATSANGLWWSNENAKDINGAFTLAEEISSDNWYYIIREFYYPVEFENDGVTAKTVQVRYMAIARKGSEFGSGVANSGGEMGSEIEWYYPGDGKTAAEKKAELAKYNTGGANTWDFTSNSKVHYNHPYTVDANGSHVVEHGTGWYVSAKPGGLRVGGMANFAGVKGYNIREGVGEGSFDKDSDTVAEANVTGTAKTFFLPTISSFQTTTSSSASGIVVNVYLGNNGRILVDDSTLVVTKTVNTLAGSTSVASAAAKSEQFEFEVEVEGFFGARGAVLITRDEFNRELWRRRFDSIDVLTDNRHLLLGDNGELALVDAEGRRVVAVEETVDGKTVTKYYLAQKGANGEVIKYAVDEKGRLKKDAAGNLIEDNINGIIVASTTPVTGGVYYVYVSQNLRTGLYNDKTLRVFKADIKQDADGFVPENALTSGDIYGNQSLRGGRTYYLTREQYDALDPAVKAKGNLVAAGQPDSAGVGRLFVFHLIGDAETAAGYAPGDREFWINKVYLIPIGKVDSNWASAFAKHEAGYNNQDPDKPETYLHDNDWRTGYAQEEEDTALLNELPAGSILLSQFKIAHIRTEEDGGNTTATELSSNNGFYIKSNFLTSKVKFEVCKNPSHSHADNTYGVATFMLTDGQGLGFNDIGNGSNYAVTEIISTEQSSRDIRFQQVDHVQDARERTRYVYSDTPNFSTDPTAANAVRLKSDNDHAPHSYWDEGRLGKNASIVQSYVTYPVDELGPADQGYEHPAQDLTNPPRSTGQTGEDSGGSEPSPGDGSEGGGSGSAGRTYTHYDVYEGKGSSLQHYFWYGSERVQSGDGPIELAANFSEKNRYTVVGDTSLYEEGVHFVNFVPSISKQEFTPGEGESVYVDDLITYTVLWQNYEYDTASGKAGEAKVTITDPLDPGLDFVSAVFNPFHGNIADVGENDPNAGNNFDRTVYQDEYQYMLQLEDAEYRGKAPDSAKLKELQSVWRTGDLTLEARKTEVDGETKPVSVNTARTYSAAENEFTDPVTGDAKTKDIPRVGELEQEQMTVTITYDSVNHRVQWVIENAPSNTYGYVELTVRVNSSAVKDWDYDRPAEDMPDNQVVNRATVQVADNPEQRTERIENPTGDPHKTEPNPGEGIQVVEGQKVDYVVDWFNTTGDNNATVIIEDRLDSGVWFYMAGIASDSVNEDKVEIAPEGDDDDAGEGKNLYAAYETAAPEPAQPPEVTDPTVDPDADPDPAPGNSGIDPDPASGAGNLSLNPDPVESGLTQILSGLVQTIGEDGAAPMADGQPAFQMTAESEPVRPRARVGDTVTYTIDLRSIPEDAVNAVIVDRLDPGVDFAGADNGGVYDSAGHTVIWTWEKTDGGDEVPDEVTLTVKINDKAHEVWAYDGAGNISRNSNLYNDEQVVNMAAITYTQIVTVTPPDIGGPDGEETTQPTEDPDAAESPETTQPPQTEEKTSTGYTNEAAVGVEPKPEKNVEQINGAAAAAGQAVKIGDTITYTISWKNDGYDNDGYTAATVKITDVLDPGVDFVSADNGGIHDSGTHTVTWTLTAAGGQSGEVTLTVKVNDRAQEKWEYNENTGEIRFINGGDSQIVNKAQVAVGTTTGSLQYTNVVETPLNPKPKKTAYASNAVQIGEVIQYNIEWTANDGEPVTVTDILDPGLTFYSAGITGKSNASVDYRTEPYGSDGITLIVIWTFADGSTIEVRCENYTGGVPGTPAEDGDVSGEAGSGDTPEGDDDAGTDETVTIDYSACDRVTVIWTTTGPGEVSLVVSVNEHAGKDYAYTENGYGITGGTGKDDQVVNMARVQAGDNNIQFTDLVVKSLAEAPEPPTGKGYPYDGHKDKMLTTDADGQEHTVYLNGQKVTVTITYEPATHTIRWTLTNVPAYYNGKVYFSVIVNARADYEWTNRDESNWPEDRGELAPEWSEDEDDADYRIYNQARVKINNEDWKYTNTIENPTRPEKAETEPGDGLPVQVGREISYTITWLNDAYLEGKYVVSTVTIIDKLDPGVDFVKAGFLLGGVPAADLPGCSVKTETDANGMVTVIWELKNQAPGATGMVYLTVKVNEKAVEKWYYDKNTGELVRGEDGYDGDYVFNMARVQVENGSDQFTNIPENPVDEGPRKTETSPGDGEDVQVGQKITYEITWINDAYLDGKYVASTVTITDRLDPGVDFVEASFGGVTLSGTGGNSGSISDGDITVSYDKSSHTVTWVLKNRAARAEGTVELTVEVNSRASEYWHYEDGTPVQGTEPGSEGFNDGKHHVFNRARVQVENGSDQVTNIPQNPITPPDGGSTPPPTPSETPDPSRIPTFSETPDPSETPTSSETPDPSETPTSSETLPPGETLPPDIPKTGDESQLDLWVTLLGLSLAGVLVSLIYTVRKLKRDNEKDDR